ncbi:DUF421 domain-containing protein [uncultured Roseobacter sp.]|uniref:DUF421 domain-containing protein n=1 Tax=uncultured Roseobacter sp. TaxID=114847 RepID=UPI002632C47C|nr:YetF domain-containing protein [uncultured Roseobacter sp.]
MLFEPDVLDVVARGTILAILALLWVIVAVRITGLRAFSKMTAFDFVGTVAIGSLLAGASQATEWAAFFQALFSIAALLAVQVVVAKLRQSSSTFMAAIQNCPLLLMREGEIIQAALHASRVSEQDLLAKLREANVLDFSEVRAVVLETTGDISVLHGPAVEKRLLRDVTGVG